MTTIPIIDVFAGPGGLGEGFTRLADNAGQHPFKILLSAEADSNAHSTLRLRAYQRELTNNGEETSQLMQYCLGERKQPYTKRTKTLWDEANNEALCIELGTQEGDSHLYRELKSQLHGKDQWVLIGGPPCQAYSIAGRVRNKGNHKYVPMDDNRHFLYREYLRVINEYRPAVFVMENVRGMLSCQINGKLIAHQILEDLACAGDTKECSESLGYRIYSLVEPVCFEQGMDVMSINTGHFVVKAEEHGIPQTRHRVILLGVRNDINSRPSLLPKTPGPNVEAMISNMPRLRSGFSRGDDSPERWHEYVSTQLWNLAECAQEDGQDGLAEDLEEYGYVVSDDYLHRAADTNGSHAPHVNLMPPELSRWITGCWPGLFLNHETRAHMDSDLRRYAFAATFAQTYNRYPKGMRDFALPGLAPAHENWDSGAFADRFRVQQEGRPASTITSHISKDGHYFIHPDPSQCRSFTVREAARIQTFPDDYFFCGPRTSQYTQVGNAVPPYLANQIARIVYEILK